MGSFGLTEEMEKAIRESKLKASSSADATAGEKVDIPQELDDTTFDVPVKEDNNNSKPDKTEVPTEEQTATERLESEIEELSKSVGFKLSEDDIWSILYNQTLVKDGVIIIPGKFEASFRLLNSTDNHFIDKKMAEFIDGKFLEEGYKNEMTLWLLAHGVVKMGKISGSKDLGDTAEARYTIFSNLPVIMLDKLARKWNDFTRLCNSTLELEYNEGN
jgi:hypothetical protein